MKPSKLLITLILLFALNPHNASADPTQVLALVRATLVSRMDYNQSLATYFASSASTDEKKAFFAEISGHSSGECFHSLSSSIKEYVDTYRRLIAMTEETYFNQPSIQEEFLKLDMNSEQQRLMILYLGVLREKNIESELNRSLPKRIRQAEERHGYSETLTFNHILRSLESEIKKGLDAKSWEIWTHFIQTSRIELAMESGISHLDDDVEQLIKNIGNNTALMKNVSVFLPYIQTFSNIRTELNLMSDFIQKRVSILDNLLKQNLSPENRTRFEDQKMVLFHFNLNIHRKYFSDLCVLREGIEIEQKRTQAAYTQQRKIRQASAKSAKSGKTSNKNESNPLGEVAVAALESLDLSSEVSFEKQRTQSCGAALAEGLALSQATEESAVKGGEEYSFQPEPLERNLQSSPIFNLTSAFSEESSPLLNESSAVAASQEEPENSTEKAHPEIAEEEAQESIFSYGKWGNKERFFKAIDRRRIANQHLETLELMFDDTKNHLTIDFNEMVGLIQHMKGTFKAMGSSHGIVTLPGGVSHAWRPHGRGSSKLPRHCVQAFRKAFIMAEITPELFK